MCLKVLNNQVNFKLSFQLLQRTVILAVFLHIQEARQSYIILSYQQRVADISTIFNLYFSKSNCPLLFIDFKSRVARGSLTPTLSRNRNEPLNLSVSDIWNMLSLAGFEGPTLISGALHGAHKLLPFFC